MKRLAVFFIFAGLFLSVSLGGLYTQEYNDDPFKPMLPKKEAVKSVPVVTGKIKSKELEIVITGISWGAKFPQAIINSEVYKVGDKIKGLDATVESIDPKEVGINYNGSIKYYALTKKAKEKKKP